MIIRIAILLWLLSATPLLCQIILSHNDYEQEIPLHDAMNGNFDIIEADVFLRDNTIVVCHDEDEISKAPTLEELYIRPLKNYTSEQLKGKVLMLDIKEYSTDMMKAINVTQSANGIIFDHMSILISGDFERQILAEYKDYNELLIDGRCENIESNINTDQMPIISIKITEIVSWNGCRKIKRKEALKLKSVIDMVHNSGRKIRFWNVEDDHQSWNVLRALGVDIIGVDDLKKMTEYLHH